MFSCEKNINITVKKKTDWFFSAIDITLSKKKSNQLSEIRVDLRGTVILELNHFFPCRIACTECLKITLEKSYSFTGLIKSHCVVLK